MICDLLTRRLGRVFGAALLLALLVGNGVATAATGVRAPSTSGSLVLQHGGQIWVVRPDGSHLHRVTHNGSKANPYTEPTQADNGIVLAARGYTTLYRMDRNGRVLSPAMKVASGLNFPGSLHSLALGPALSRDGSTAAVSVVTTQGVIDPTTGVTGTNILAQDVLVVDAVHARKIQNDHLAGTYLMSPSWIDSQRMLLFAPYNVVAPQVYVFPARGGGKNWFADEDTTGGSFVDRQPIDRGQLSRQGDKLALIHGTNLKSNWRQASIQIYGVKSLTSAPTPLCSIRAQHGMFGRVTWSPDGSSLAWSDSQGVWVSSLNTASSNCGVSPRLIVKGAANPFWGPTGVQ